MTTVNAVTMVLQRPDGRILMQLRDDGQGTPIPFPNTWNFPGGVVEAGETPLAAGTREIAEEFEISVDSSSCRQVWRFAHQHALNDHVFLCTVPADVVPVLHEGAAFAWMTVQEIAALELGFDQVKIVPHIAPNVTS